MVRKNNDQTSTSRTQKVFFVPLVHDYFILKDWGLLPNFLIQVIIFYKPFYGTYTNRTAPD